MCKGGGFAESRWSEKVNLESFLRKLVSSSAVHVYDVQGFKVGLTHYNMEVMESSRRERPADK